MLKIIFSCLCALVFGILLATDSDSWLVRPGYLGASLLIGGAVLLRSYWNRRQMTVGDEPSAAEQNVWLWMIGTAVLCGYVITVLSQPGSEVHTTTGDTGGLDSWFILSGLVIAAGILRNRGVRRDERDIAISNFAIKMGYTALISLLIILLMCLGFASEALMQRFTHWLLANVLLSTIMLACLVQYLAQLVCYWKEMRHVSRHP